MGYLSNLASSLAAQINTVTTDGERAAIASQLVIVQRASGQLIVV